MWVTEVRGFWKYGINALISVPTDAQPIAEKYRRGSPAQTRTTETGGTGKEENSSEGNAAPSESTKRVTHQHTTHVSIRVRHVKGVGALETVHLLRLRQGLSAEWNVEFGKSRSARPTGTAEEQAGTATKNVRCQAPT